MNKCLIHSAKYVIWIVVSFCLFLESALASTMKVAFINPTYPNEPFWSLMTDVMTAAAKDLEIELRVYYSERNRFKSLELVEEILSSEHKPDYLIFHFQAQMGGRMLQAAEQAKVYSLVINTSTPEADKLDIGQPRGKFKYWLGHIIPDDFQAGSLLAGTLIGQAVAQNKFAQDGRIHTIGLTGTGDNTASVERDLGINKVVNERNDVRLHQIVNASWDKDKAYQITKVLMARYPETRVIWSASDVMALGASAALEDLGLKPGEDVLVGGIDGVRVGLSAIKAGDFNASVTGHFIEGAWALVLLYDHYHGQDLLKERNSILHSKMTVVDAKNVEHFLNKLHSRYFDQFDFKAFSSLHKPKSATLPFLFPEAILSEMGSQFTQAETTLKE